MGSPLSRLVDLFTGRGPLDLAKVVALSANDYRDPIRVAQVTMPGRGLPDLEIRHSTAQIAVLTFALAVKPRELARELAVLANDLEDAVLDGYTEAVEPYQRVNGATLQILRTDKLHEIGIALERIAFATSYVARH